MSNQKYRILSIDGGGIRGIIPASILVELERKLQEKTGKGDARLSDYFDLISGTSTGALLACGLTAPSENGSGNKYSAKDGLNIYLNDGDKIFNRSFWQKLTSLWGLIDEKHNEEPYEKILKARFGDLRLSELKKPTIAVSYNIDNKRSNTKYKIQLFKQHRAKTDPKRDFLVRDSLRGSSAAPTFFEPKLVKPINEKNHPGLPCIDGGVIANNPAMIAYIEAKKLRPGLQTKDIVLVSLGTGDLVTNYPFKKAQNWGYIGWGLPFIDIVFGGGSIITNYFLDQLFSENKGKYFRLNPQLHHADSKLDNASEKNIKALHRDGSQAAKYYDQILNDIIDQII